MIAQTSDSNFFENLSLSENPMCEPEQKWDTQKQAEAWRAATKGKTEVLAPENYRRATAISAVLHSEHRAYHNKLVIPTAEQQLSNIITLLQTTFKTC